MDTHIRAAYICGNCGNNGISNEDYNEYGCCVVCGADYWIETQDFNHPDLQLDYIDKAAKKLQTTRKELYNRLLKLSGRSRFLRCPKINLPMYLNHPDPIVRDIVERRMRHG